MNHTSYYSIRSVHLNLYYITFFVGLLFYTTFVQAKGSFTVPIKFIQDIPHVELNINGQKATFLLDTGSSRGLHLTKDWMEKIDNLHILPEKQGSTDITGKIIFTEQFIIPQININDMKFTDIEGNELQPWGLSLGNEDEVDPLKNEMTIGLGLFKDKQLLLDYAKNTMTVAESDVDLRSSLFKWQEIPFILDQEGLIIKLKQKDKLYSFVLDTGASISVTSSKNNKGLLTISCAKAAINMDTGDHPCQVAIFNVYGTPTPIKLSVLDLATFGEDISALGKAGLIGANFLQKHNMLINMKTKQVWITVE